MTTGEMSPLSVIADAVRRRECILFLGAGVHAPPPEGSVYDWPREYCPVLGADLSAKLARLCGLDERYPMEDTTNLARVATFFENRFSRHRLVQTIAQEVHDRRRPSPMLQMLARLDFPLIINTNFDGFLEDELRQAGKKPRLAIYTPASQRPDDPDIQGPDSPIVYKLHGDLGSPESVVVTDEDLMKFTMRMTESDAFNPVPVGLKYHLTKWTTLFVGYSLRDYNLRLLLTTLRWRIDSANIPDMFSVDLNPDPLVLEVWENKHRYVKFLAEDVWTFVPSLCERVYGREYSQ